ncbi:tRNA uridine-5-carboxymethylaminomethyl(34) synthesis GTPase MnmE, partial [archaeon]
VQECLRALDRFLARPASIDMAAEDLRLGTHELGCLTGRVDVEELLDVIFSDFCIGK